VNFPLAQEVVAFKQQQRAEQLRMYQAAHPEVQAVYDAYFKEFGRDMQFFETTHPDGTIEKAKLAIDGYPASDHGELLLPVAFFWQFLPTDYKKALLIEAGMPAHRVSEFLSKRWKDLKIEGRVRIYAILCARVDDSRTNGAI
jgi:hypothetical protein